VRVPGGPARFHRTHYVIVAFVIALLTAASASGFAWASKRVVLMVDGNAVEITTRSSDVASLLEEASVSVADGDLVSPPPRSTIEDGDLVVVRHAVPVTLIVGEQKFDLEVIGRTVADALTVAGMDPTSGTQTEPGIDTPLRAGMEIRVTDVFLRVAQEQADIPYDVIVQGDPNLPTGARQVLTQGVAGRALRVYQVLVTGGVEGARFLRAERLLSEKVDEVVSVGTKRAFRQVMVSRGGLTEPPAPPVVGETRRLEATAYTPWDPGCGGIRVIAHRKEHYGIPDGWGVIAVDPRVIPLGTKVFVEGYGYAVAADTGGAIKGNIIDVCFWGADLNVPTNTDGEDQRATAFRLTERWGRRTVDVTLLGR
jgi:uncharacterized protein YabE (DUF348 family)/3D (Asp-Asp-Asp) domain-containing protein